MATVISLRPKNSERRHESLGEKSPLDCLNLEADVYGTLVDINVKTGLLVVTDCNICF